MGQPVVIVAVLVGVEVLIRMLPVQFADFADGTVGTVACGRVDDLSSVGMQHLFALRAGGGGHAESHGKLQRRAQHGISKTGVAAGRVQQGALRLRIPQFARRHRRTHNGRCRAVLDTTAGVGELRLAQQRDAGQVGDNTVQPDHRRIADTVQHRLPQRKFVHQRFSHLPACMSRVTSPGCAKVNRTL